MSTNSILSKIRQEIERRKKYESENYHDRKADGRPNEGWAESLAIMGELEELLSFLDTLSEEPSESLEEAAESHTFFAANQPGQEWETHDVTDAFIAGAEWMAGHFEKERLRDCDELTPEDAQY